jgi:hypothetical protein
MRHLNDEPGPATGTGTGTHGALGRAISVGLLPPCAQQRCPYEEMILHLHDVHREE